MQQLSLPFKKLCPDAVAPRKASQHAAGFDLVACSVHEDSANNTIVYGTGLALEIPNGYVGLLFPRSSVCKKALQLANSVGVIDADYRGEIRAVFRKTADAPLYAVGERVCQLVILPLPECIPVEQEELASSERGSGGFGSTGA